MFVKLKNRLFFLIGYFLHAKCLQLCLGILLGALLKGLYPWLGLIGAVLMLVVLAKGTKAFAMFLLGLLIMSVRVLISDDGQADISSRSDFVGEEITAEARISSDIDFEASKARYVVEMRSLQRGDEWIPIRGNILIYANRYPPKREGEIIIVKGSVKEPAVMNTDDFNYGDYLRNKGIIGVIFRGDLQSTGKKELNFIKEFILFIREKMLQKIKSLLPEPHAGLLAGILFGVEAEMPDDFAESLRLTGTTHIIAASGYNITVLIGLIDKLFGFLHKKFRDWLSILGIWIYVVFLGGSLPIVRAAIMGTIGIWAKMRGYEAVPIVSLALSGAVLLTLNPQNLGKISFQLSMLSSFGLIYLVPVFEIINFPSIIAGIKEDLFTTLSAVLVTAPVIIGNFGTFSFVALAANILVSPLIEVIMLLGSVVMLLPRRLCPPVLVATLWAVEEGFVKIVEHFAEFPFAYVIMEANSGSFGYLISFAIMVLILIYYPENGIGSPEDELEYLIL
jgi:competence protein ComEC